MRALLALLTLALLPIFPPSVAAGPDAVGFSFFAPEGALVELRFDGGAPTVVVLGDAAQLVATRPRGCFNDDPGTTQYVPKEDLGGINAVCARHVHGDVISSYRFAYAGDGGAFFEIRDASGGYVNWSCDLLVGGGAEIFSGSVTGTGFTPNCSGFYTPSIPAPAFEAWTALAQNRHGLGGFALLTA